MAVRLTVLCENTVGSPGALIGEHGFSCLVETPQGNYLFDTGQGLGVAHNARLLNRSLQKLDAVALSHGHYDHAGGLPQVLKETGDMDVFAHPDIFSERYALSPGGKRSLGIPASRQELEGLGARFRLERERCEVGPGVWLTGEIPRITPYETGDPNLVVPSTGAGAFIPDPFLDDLSLVVETPSGLVVILGCAHAGVVNILSEVARQTGGRHVHALLGGTHLGPASESQFAATMDELASAGIERVGVSHCTGMKRACALASRFGSRFFFASAGSVLEF